MFSSRKRVSTDHSHDIPPAKIKKENEEAVVEANNASAKPFSESTITLAVDVSGSTAGRTLYVEKKAILAICSELSAAARTEAKIVAWDDKVRPTLGIEYVHSLYSEGGTHPSKVCSTESSIAALRKSSLWFLMTDGEVPTHEVHKFANAVPSIQLHGTACVIIIFGTRPTMPKNVNVSVGYCVFAVAPHCLLLFHDTDTDEVYVLRAKGCFETLLPMEEDPSPSIKLEIKAEDNKDPKRNTWILPDTPTANEETWADLSRIKYHSLAALPIPAPIPLSTDHIALSNGTTVSFSDVLNNRLPEPVTAQLFANERDMATIVTTAGSRGESRRANTWLDSHGEDQGHAVRQSRRMLTASTTGGHSTLDGLGGSSRRGVSSRAEEDRSFGSAATLVGTGSRGNTADPEWDAYLRRVHGHRGV